MQKPHKNDDIVLDIMFLPLSRYSSRPLPSEQDFHIVNPSVNVLVQLIPNLIKDKFLVLFVYRDEPEKAFYPGLGSTLRTLRKYYDVECYDKKIMHLRPFNDSKFAKNTQSVEDYLRKHDIVDNFVDSLADFEEIIKNTHDDN